MSKHKHKFVSGATVRVVDRNQLRGGKRYNIRQGKQLSLLPGLITCNGDKLVEITYDDGGREYAHPNNLIGEEEVDSAIKWHGGKNYLASRIVSLIPNDIFTYCEPYAGSMAVLFHRDPAQPCSEVVNDINSELMNFWYVLKNPALFPKFQLAVNLTPFSEEVWERANSKCINNGAPDSMVESAVKFFVRCRQSYAGRMTDFAALSTSRLRRGMNEQVAAWLSAIDGLPYVADRLKKVFLYNRPALDVIAQCDNARTLFYLDPPYVHETRAAQDVYEHEMSEAQHEQLLTMLASINGKFILSGYRCALYDRYSDKHSWYRMDIDIANHSAAGADKRRMVESIWLNYKP